MQENKEEVKNNIHEIPEEIKTIGDTLTKLSIEKMNILEDTIGSDTLANVFQQALSRKQNKPVLDYLDSLSEEQLKECIKQYDLHNKSLMKDKYLRAWSASLVNNDLEHCQALFNTMLNKYLEEPELKTLAKEIGTKYLYIPSHKMILTRKKIKKENYELYKALTSCDSVIELEEVEDEQ